MAKNNLENELRNLKNIHLTEIELVAYSDQELDQTRRALAEAHLTRCFICERQLVLLREESEALDNRATTAANPAEIAKEIPLQERLAEYLRQMVAGWRIYFGQGALRGEVDQGEEVWRWQSDDGKLLARATMEKNADLTIHFSSNEIELEGERINIRMGTLSQEITLRRVSESEVDARVAVPWRQRQRDITDISIERV